MSGWSRRRFLAAAGLVGIGLAAGAVGWRRRQLLAWLANPGLPGGATGALREAEVAVLAAAARTLLDDGITLEAYVDCFRWRSEHVPGYRRLYAAFAAEADAGARRAGAAGFAAAPAAVRARVLESLAPRRRWRRIADGLLRRDHQRYARHVLREIVRMYVHTDGWRRAGYDTPAWGPRGFDGLDAPPRGSA